MTGGDHDTEHLLCSGEYKRLSEIHSLMLFGLHRGQEGKYASSMPTMCTGMFRHSQQLLRQLFVHFGDCVAGKSKQFIAGRFLSVSLQLTSLQEVNLLPWFLHVPHVKWQCQCSVRWESQHHRGLSPVWSRQFHLWPLQGLCLLRWLRTGKKVLQVSAMNFIKPSPWTVWTRTLLCSIIIIAMGYRLQVACFTSLTPVRFGCGSTSIKVCVCRVGLGPQLLSCSNFGYLKVEGQQQQTYSQSVAHLQTPRAGRAVLMFSLYDRLQREELFTEQNKGSVQWKWKKRSVSFMSTNIACYQVSCPFLWEMWVTRSATHAHLHLFQLENTQVRLGQCL